MPTDRAPRHRYDRFAAIDLGHEPPLSESGEQAEKPELRPVSLRWLAGTVLTAFAGVALMGGAVYAALDGSTRFAGAPSTLGTDALARMRGDRTTNSARKSDRIAATPDASEARQEMKLTTVNRVGDREVVRIRPVKRLSVQLATAVSDRIADIPDFNPMTIFAESGEAAAAASDQPAGPDGDVSYVVRDLATLRLTERSGPTLPSDDVLVRVREAAAVASSGSGGAIRLAAIGSAQGFGFAAEPGARASFPTLGDAPRASNTTVVSRRVLSDAADRGEDVRSVTLQAPARLEQVLEREGATAADARLVASAFGAADGYGTVSLAAGQQVEILMAADDRDPARSRPIRVQVYSEGGLAGAVALSDTGQFVAIDDTVEEVEVAEERGGERGTAKIYDSLYETALRYEMPQELVGELVKVFGTDVDFQRRVARGDAMEVVYDDDSSSSEVLYAAISLDGELRRYYRYQLPDGGVDYFDENGLSARKFLMRKPVASGQLRSGFGMRRHPILGYSKMHTGVDFATPRGTPIYASGNGTVSMAKRHGGYGNYVKVRHANGYETAYAHMQSFARGISEGTRVRQGQLIGYVGSTGLSTGPHLHYEVLVNGRFVNPMRIRVPRETELSGEALAQFERERERIDALLKHTAPTRMAAAGGG